MTTRAPRQFHVPIAQNPRRPSRSHAAASLVALALAAGCGAPKPGPRAAAGPDPAPPAASDDTKGLTIAGREVGPLAPALFPESSGGGNDGNASRDAQKSVKVLIQLAAYRMQVPVRSVSQGEEFWKHVDEQSVDVATHDRLYRNGLRVGIAPRNEWDYFRNILLQSPVLSQQTNSAGVGGSSFELPVKTGIAAQYLFWFDNANLVKGRSYDRCENLFTIDFSAVPRQPGTVRAALCPVVRAERVEYRVTVRNEEMPAVTKVRPEQYYDLNLITDIPLDHFLIVSPSPEANRPSSVGRAFLVQDGPAEQFETVLILAPQPFRLDELAKPATTQAALAPK